jgi:enoyl-CoA hydratase
MVPAQEALQLGLVNKVVTQQDLLEEAEKLMKTILSKGPLAVKYVLDAVNHGLNMGLPEALDYEASLFALVAQTEDRKEGAQAFLEKRPAKFQGK